MQLFHNFFIGCVEINELDFPNDNDVGIYEFEDEGFMDERLVIFRLKLVVLQIYQTLSNILVDEIDYGNNPRINNSCH